MANVLHRETLQYLESVHTPDYAPAVWLINPDLSAVEGVDPKYWKIQDGEVVEMSSEEKDAKFLDQFKEDAFQSIDARTAELIAGGFVYEDLRFSLSLAAQLRMSELTFLLSNGGLDFPMVWNTLDDQGQLEFLNSIDVRAFIQEGSRTVVAIVNSGTRLKTQVRTALTISEVGLVLDER